MQNWVFSLDPKTARPNGASQPDQLLCSLARSAKSGLIFSALTLKKGTLMIFFQPRMIKRMI